VTPILWLVARPKLIVGIVLAALAAGWTLVAYRHGVKTERAAWTERQRAAEAASRQTERDLAVLTEKAAARITQKEQMLTERAKRHAEQIRTILAGVPDCRLPRAVGRVLDATAGVSATPAVAEPVRPEPDDSALDAVIGLAETLDVVNANYAICRANNDRLTAAAAWYTDLRARVNKE
jgi:hypothetical protein